MLLRWLSLCMLANLARTTPTIYLPINAQVPPVARVGQSFNFKFSKATTASSSPGPTTYSLSGAPSWLSLDGQARVFSGTPQASDKGAFVVDLVATDSTGSLSMSVTLVVTDDPGPGLGMSVADQLPAYGSFQSPNALLVAPSSPISINFSPNTFTNAGPQTNFYALSANNTPLPSWIRFDPIALSFVGTAPHGISPDDSSETFQLEMAASNVVGFAQAIVTFQIIVETHLLEFKNNLQIVNITGGEAIHNSILKDSLLLDNQPVDLSDIHGVNAQPPGWLSLDPATLTLSGIPPANVGAQNFTVSVTDTLNNSASTIVILQAANASASSLLSPIGAVNATIGRNFTYSLNDTTNQDALSLSVDLGTASSWLRYDEQGRRLVGSVPSDLRPQQVVVNITASSGSESESEILTIAVQKPGSSIDGSGDGTQSAGTNDNEASSSSSSSKAASGGVFHGQDRRWIAAVVLLPLALLVSAILIIFCCCRRRRRRRQRRQRRDRSGSVRSGSISSSSGKGHLAAVTVEKIPEYETRSGNPGDGTDIAMSGGLRRVSSRISLPPRLPWTWLPGASKGETRNRASRLSFAEKPQRPDSWSRFAANFISLGQTRPVNMSQFKNIPEETTPPKTSPKYSLDEGQEGIAGDTDELVEPAAAKLKKQRASEAVSLGSSGLLYKNIMSASTGNGTRALGRGHGSVLLHVNDASSTGPGAISRPARFGIVQRSWRNASDSQSTSDWTDITADSSQRESNAKAGNNVIGARGRGPTIRPVWPSQSYSKRNSRASSGLAAPQLAVPKSVRVRQSENPFLAGRSVYPRDFSASSAMPRSSAAWRQGRQRTTDARRQSSGDGGSFQTVTPSNKSPTSTERRRLSTFDYTIAPRVLDSASARESPVPFHHAGIGTGTGTMTRDRRFESAVPSESQSMYDYSSDDEDARNITHRIGRAIGSEGDEEQMDNENDNVDTAEGDDAVRFWQPRYPSTIELQNAENGNENENEVIAEPESSAAWLARRKDGGLQKLLQFASTRRLEGESSAGEERISKSDMDDDTLDLRLRSPPARRLAPASDLHNAGNSYASVRGDIKGSGSSSFL